jgi:hypothetical protein
MTPIALNARVRLRDPDLYRDIGSRAGTVIDIAGWARVRWDGFAFTTRIMVVELEVMDEIAN